MSAVRRMVCRLANPFGRARREREWNAEFESHVEMQTADNLRAGMNAEEARRQALLQFGGIESVKETMRDLSGFRWLDATAGDGRYALRSLRRSPGFAVTAVLSLALGLGASLAVFTVADNLLVRPLPFRDAGRLAMVWEANRKSGEKYNVVSPANYLDWKSHNDVFETLAGISPVRSAVLNDRGHAEEFGARSVSADFFPLLGVRPVRGRLFSSAEDRPAAPNSATVALISYRLWQNWFGGEEDIVGRRVEVNALPCTIIGVLPPGFRFLDQETELWGPLGLNPAQDYRKVSGRWMLSVGRLRRGVNIARAGAHMTGLARRLEESYPAFNTNWTVHVEPLRDAMFRKTETPLLVLLAAAGMLLAVACANVANLLLARYNSRARETAIRASLGAGRWRVVRQLLTESLVLGTAGGILGLALARWAVTGLVLLAPKDLLNGAGIQMDSRIAIFAVVLSALTVILFGMAPALVASRPDLLHAFRGDSRSGFGAGRRLRSWLVGAEVAIAVILLAGATLLFRSLVGLETVNPGFDPSNLLTFRVTLPPARYHEAYRLTGFFATALEQIERLPGVRSASAASCLPFTGACARTSVNIEGRPRSQPGEEMTAYVQTVMPGYFHTLGIPLRSGRDLSDSDNTATAPYRFIVNEAFVREFLHAEQPLGQRINVIMDVANPFGEIIGVVANARELFIDHEPAPAVYYVHSHLSYPGMVFLVRVDRHPLGFSQPARKIIQRLDAAEPIAEVRTMEAVLGENFSRQRFSAWLLLGFAAVALALAAIGIYGILAYSVAARTREFGVRAALGADSGSIIALVLKSAAAPVGVGLLTGIGGALALTKLLKALLFGIGPRDPLTFAIVPALLAAVALLAAFLPARRAARLDPMGGLRVE